MIAAIVVVIVVVAIAGYFLLTATSPASKKLKVAMSLDAGANIPGWSHSGYLALKEVESKFGAEIAYSEFITFADAQRDLETFAAAGYNLVWGHGGQYDDAAVKAGAKYPNTYFMTTGTTSAAANVRPYAPKFHEMSYLAGVLAGLTTKTNKIGVINGGEFPIIGMITNAVIEGVKSVNPSATVTVSYVGSFTEPVKGKDFATSMIQAGADVFVSWAGFTSTGIFEAVRGKSNVYVIAEHQDYYDLGKDVSIGTYMMNYIPNLTETVQDIVDGKFTGTLKTPGIKQGVLDFINISSSLPQTARDKIAQVRQDIIDGKFTAPEIWPK